MTSFEGLPPTSPLGLGCSRLGSVLGATEEQSVELIRAALDHGINVFDTSDIYGQGDSEKLLGKMLGNRADVVVCTKIGKVISRSRRLLLPFKRVIRGIAKRSPSAKQTVRAARAQPMPTNWSPAYLTAAIDRSLRRLRRERIDILMLHSPDAETIREGVAVDTLARAKALGKVGLAGLSVDSIDAAEAALMDDRVSVLQIPIHPGSQEFAAVVRQASERNVRIIAREIFGGVHAGAPLSADERARSLAALVANDGIAVSLIGTTRAAHLAEAVGSLPVPVRPAC